MRALAVAAIIASLTVPAYAQDPSKEQSNREADQRKKEEESIEKAYKEGRRQEIAPAAAWREIRPVGQDSRGAN